MPVTLQPTTLKYRNNGENQWHEADVLKGTDISPAVADIEPTTTAIAAHAIGDLFILDGKLYKTTSAIAIGDTIITSGSGANCEETTITDEIPTVPVQDVQVNGSSILQNGVANVPKATSTSLGLVKAAFVYGSMINANGEVCIYAAPSSTIKAGTQVYQPIPPSKQHESTFYGLAKAAGDATQSQSSNPVGTYTDEAKAAIQQMLDVPSTDDIPEVPVTDVQFNGVSVVQNGVANIVIPLAEEVEF